MGSKEGDSLLIGIGATGAVIGVMLLVFALFVHAVFPQPPTAVAPTTSSAPHP